MTNIKDIIDNSLKEYSLFASADEHIDRKEVISLTNYLRSLMIPSFYKTDLSFDEIYAFVAKLIDKAFSYNTYEKVLEVLRKQKFIVLYENGSARLFDTAEELVRFYIEIVRECQCDIDDILMRLDVLLANNNMFINLLEAAVNYKEKK